MRDDVAEYLVLPQRAGQSIVVCVASGHRYEIPIDPTGLVCAPVRVDRPPRRPRGSDTNQARQVRAARRREALVLLIGDTLDLGPGYARCDRCRSPLSADRLEIDHVDGRSWSPSSMNAWRRVAMYWREWRGGVRLRVLCRTCNASDGQRFRGRS